MNNRIALTVTSLNAYVDGIMRRDPVLSKVSVEGEISNFTAHHSGHMYFSLKDAGARIDSVMFASNTSDLDFMPADGDKVIIDGYVSIYAKTGKYQLYAETMGKVGAGDLSIAFEKLKAKLKAEGLFDDELKKTLPLIPKRIAVVTSHTGAAIRDIINVTARRWPSVKLLVIPVLVQGDDAKSQIAFAIEYINSREDIDLIITGRGGGSLEDLWAFNEEVVARAIHNSRIPIISAVGHQSDFTISDMVADKRAPTPSAAAEMAVPDYNAVMDIIQNLRINLVKNMNSILNIREDRLKALSSSPVYRKPERIMDAVERQVIDLESMLTNGMDRLVDNCDTILAKLIVRLDAVSPLSVLLRGYAMITDDNDHVISSASIMNIGDSISVRLKDGISKCRVDEVTMESIN